MKKPLWLIPGFIWLIGIEILKVYFIMPFPGSQHSDTIAYAYFLHNNIWWLRLLGLLLVILPAARTISQGKIWQKVLLVLSLGLYLFICYLFNFRFLADKIFKQPTINSYMSSDKDTTDNNKLVIGVVINNIAKAYPVQVIGYHHQVRDTIAGKHIMVTYCTVCRTGRVYAPEINGKAEQFRLVGMDHFNAMFEDASTKSWWQQATGAAIAGELKGQQLAEIPSAQMRLSEWKNLYPQSWILQPDPVFKKQYAELKGYDDGAVKSKLEKRDSTSWQFKSWVIGIQLNGQSRAYDWNQLVAKKMLSDSLNGKPLLLTVEPHGKTWYSFSRVMDGKVLQFTSTTDSLMEDNNTHSRWTRNGTCITGVMAGKQLEKIQSYQEFWHSWKQFHPQTTTF
jgi:hypothetical protein